MPDEYSADRYTELNRQLAMRERSRKREMRGSSAAQGTLYSGHTAAQERDIEAQTGEEWHAGSRDIEDRRWRAKQDEIARKWQSGERVGSEQHQVGMQESLFGQQTGERIGTQDWKSGERLGTQEWASGESEAERNVRMKLQSMADEERHRLQQLVNLGQMDLQDAEQEWQAFENDLNRQLEWESTTGQWGHEFEDMQAAQIQQEQWAAMFGADSAMALQDDTQMFEHFMAQVGRGWELSDRPWQEQMWLMDAQLQMLCAGYDWLNDNYNTGYPAWMISSPKEGTEFTSGTVYTYSPSSGQTYGAPGWSEGPFLDADGNPTDDQEEAVADNPNYTPPAGPPVPPSWGGGGFSWGGA